MDHKTAPMRQLACICGATISAPADALAAWGQWSKTHRGPGHAPANDRVAQGVRAAIAREARQQEATP